MSWLQFAIAVAGILGLAIALLTWRASARLRRIERSRVGESFSDFATSFSSGRVPERVLREVYVAVQQPRKLPTFPVHAADNLGEVFGIVDEDLNDLVLSLLKRLQCRVPGPSEEVLGRSVETVGDLVEYIDRLRPPPASI
jgi:hypothetical protein